MSETPFCDRWPKIERKKEEREERRKGGEKAISSHDSSAMCRSGRIWITWSEEGLDRATQEEWGKLGVSG